MQGKRQPRQIQRDGSGGDSIENAAFAGGRRARKQARGSDRWSGQATEIDLEVCRSIGTNTQTRKLPPRGYHLEDW